MWTGAVGTSAEGLRCSMALVYGRCMVSTLRLRCGALGLVGRCGTLGLVGRCGALGLVGRCDTLGFHVWYPMAHQVWSLRAPIVVGKTLILWGRDTPILTGARYLTLNVSLCVCMVVGDWIPDTLCVTMCMHGGR